MKKYAKAALSLLLLVIAVIYPSLAMKAYAADNEEIYIETNFSQSDAREMLAMINEFRTDSNGGAWYWNSDNTTKTVFNTDGNTTLCELKYDYELEKAAMQRAAEVAVSFSHTRPSGLDCFSVYPSSGYYAMGENIAAGYTSALGAFVGWQENEDPYSGQGHRRNMLSPNFNAIGIGHAYVNGIHYWTQALGYTSNETTPTTALNDTVISAITVDASKLSLKKTELTGAASYSLNIGDSVDAPDLICQYDFEEHWPSKPYITTVPTSVEWQSENSSVAYVENGKIIAVGVGNTVLTSSETSLQVTVEVKASLKITSQPQTTCVKLGSTAKLNVGASGEGLTYQWYYKAPGSSSFVKSSITSATYSATMKEIYSGRQMYCVVTDKYGNTVKSDTVYLRLAATITAQPQTTYAKLGSTTNLKVAASGEGLKYQWYYKDLGSSTFKKSSIAAAAYSTPMKESYSGRQMYCVVTDKYGNTAKSNTVYLRLAATITKQPISASAPAESKLSTSVTAVGDGLTYQWYYKKPGGSAYSKSSHTSSSYTITMKNEYSGRQMYCLVTDKYGNTAKSDIFTISVPTVKITTQPQTTYAKLGSTTNLKVAASGEGLKYQWYYKDSGSSTFKKSSIAAAAYSTPMKEIYSGRQMYCVVTDKYGNTVKSNTVYLRLAATVTKQPIGASAPVGSKLSTSVTAVGDGLTYQWYYKTPGSSSFVKSSITSATYSATMKESYSGRQMYCVVTDKYGNTAKSDVITVSVA